MPGRHEAADTFDAVVSDYVTQRARDLIRQWDEWLNGAPLAAAAGPPVDRDVWCGQAVEILRELTRNA